MKDYLKKRTREDYFKEKNRFFYCIVSLMLFMMLFLYGCKKEEVVPELSLSPQSLSFSSTGGDESVAIVSNTQWTVVSDASSWLTSTPASGSKDGNIVITAKANESASARSAKITVNASGLIDTISVSQAGSAPFLNVSRDSLIFSNEGETLSFTVESNMNWTTEASRLDKDWIKISPISGKNNGTVAVTVATNINFYNKTGFVYIEVENFKNIGKSIPVLQHGIIELSGTIRQFNYTGGQQTFNIHVPKPPVNWTVSASSAVASWITLSPKSGTGDATITVTASRNTSDIRMGDIIIKAGNIENTKFISQEYGTGDLAFWVSSDFFCGPITVTLSGHGSRMINGFYYSGSPNCGDPYTATFSNIPKGTYTYTASCSGGRTWSGTVELKSGCQTRRIN